MPILARTVATAAAFVALGTLSPAEPVAVSSSLLSDEIAFSTDPSLAVSADDRLGAAWSGAIGSRSVIALSLAGDEGWSSPLVVDASEGGACTQPVLRFAGGEAALAWVRLENGVSTLAFRSGGGGVETVTTSRVRIESPSMTVASNAGPVVAWSEGGGGRFAIMTAVRGESGKWAVAPVSTALDSYDILPTLVSRGDAQLYWYALEADGFALRSAVRREGDWLAAESGLANLVPAERLPLLFEANDDPGAVWVESIDGTEAVWSVEGALSGSSGRQTQPDAMHGLDGPAFAWREGSSGGIGIRVLVGDTEYAIADVAHPAEPRVAVGRDAVHVVFASDQLEGGTGAVYSARIAR